MKTQVVILNIFLLLLTACRKDDAVLISGAVTHATEKIVLVTYRITDIPDTIPIIDGKFTVKLPLKQPAMIILSLQKSSFELYVEPGYSMSLQLDGSKPDSSLRISGDGEREHVYIQSVDSILTEAMDARIINFGPSEEASMHFDSIREKVSSRIEEIRDQQLVTDEFLEYLKVSAEFNLAALQLFSARLYPVEDPTLFYQFLTDLPVDKGKYLSLPSARLFYSYYVLYLTNGNNMVQSSWFETEPDAYTSSGLERIKVIRDEKTREYLAYMLIQRRLEYKGLEGFDPFYSAFRLLNTEPELLLVIDQLKSEFAFTNPGQPAADFTLSDSKGNRVSMADLRGKIVYIDFWADWCGYCMKQFPDYYQLIDDYKGKNIQFISIFMGNNQDKWLSIINTHPDKGTSLMDPDGMQSALAKAYRIKSLPVYVLVDTQGRLLDVRADRPSSSAIRKTLDRLLAEK